MIQKQIEENKVLLLKIKITIENILTKSKNQFQSEYMRIIQTYN